MFRCLVVGKFGRPGTADAFGFLGMDDQMKRQGFLSVIGLDAYPFTEFGDEVHLLEPPGILGANLESTHGCAHYCLPLSHRARFRGPATFSDNLSQKTTATLETVLITVEFTRLTDVYTTLVFLLGDLRHAPSDVGS